ncbi:hypothetical protein NECAME_00215 [Necator americanus]|uniref:Uncharacterized protein n=1 Tax=Necator americanus TaxID=51031 RepID=W2TIE4_NECAM|nr:hypothetical protein NECAME_00215 [Necator americanus]ETN81865.1 hypothetical protein NECAME_00215 [Necator americanus]
MIHCLLLLALVCTVLATADAQSQTFDRQDRDYRPLQADPPCFSLFPICAGRNPTAHFSRSSAAVFLEIFIASTTSSSTVSNTDFGKRDGYRPLQFGKRDSYRPLQFGKRSPLASAYLVPVL